MILYIILIQHKLVLYQSNIFFFIIFILMLLQKIKQYLKNEKVFNNSFIIYC